MSPTANTDLTNSLLLLLVRVQNLEERLVCVGLLLEAGLSHMSGDRGQLSSKRNLDLVDVVDGMIELNGLLSIALIQN